MNNYDRDDDYSSSVYNDSSNYDNSSDGNFNGWCVIIVVMVMVDVW